MDVAGLLHMWIGLEAPLIQCLKQLPLACKSGTVDGADGVEKDVEGSSRRNAGIELSQ